MFLSFSLWLALLGHKSIYATENAINHIDNFVNWNLYRFVNMKCVCVHTSHRLDRSVYAVSYILYYIRWPVINRWNLHKCRIRAIFIIFFPSSFWKISSVKIFISIFDRLLARNKEITSCFIFNWLWNHKMINWHPFECSVMKQMNDNVLISAPLFSSFLVSINALYTPL